MSLTLGPATTESTIYAVTRRLLKDNVTSPSGFATDNIIKAYANEATIRIASLTRSRKTSNIGAAISTVAGTRTYTKPTDCLEILHVYVNGVPMRYASLDELSAGDLQNWFTQQGTPTAYYIENNKIGLYPIPSAVWNLNVIYITLPATLSADANVPDLDPRLHMAVCYWTARKIFIDRRELDFSSEMEKLFAEEISFYQASGKDSRQPQKMLNYWTSPHQEWFWSDT